MSKRKPQVRTACSANAVAGDPMQFFNPLVEKNNDDGADAQVPGKFVCVLQFHPQRGDGLPASDPFVVSAQQGNTALWEHMERQPRVEPSNRSVDEHLSLD